MEIRQLEYFIEIVNHQSFTGAAYALYTSQPALTKSIKQLEEELGVKLIDRRNNYFQLTDAGRIFYVHAKDVYNRFNDIYHVVQDTSAQISGSVTIGAMAIASEFFRDLTAEFALRFPSITLNIQEITSREVVRSVLAHTCDIGFVILPTENMECSELECKVISSDPLDAVVHKDNPLAKNEVITVDDLRGQNLLLFSDDYQPHLQILELCARKGFTPNVTNTAPRTALLMHMVANRRGISIFPAPYVSEYITSALLVKPFSPRIFRDIAIIHNKNRYLPFAVREVLQFADQYFVGTSQNFVRRKYDAP